MKKSLSFALVMLPIFAATKVQAKDGDVLFEGKVAYSDEWVWIKFGQKVESFFGLRTELTIARDSVDHFCQYQIDAVSVPTEDGQLKMKKTTDNEWRGKDFNPFKPSHNGVFLKLTKLNASPVPPPFTARSCKLTLKQSDGIIVPGRPPVKQEKVVAINTASEVMVVYNGTTAEKIYDLMKGAETKRVSRGEFTSVTSRQFYFTSALTSTFSLLCTRIAFVSPTNPSTTNECILEARTDQPQNTDVMGFQIKAGTDENKYALKVFGIKPDADLVSNLKITDGVFLESSNLDLLLWISRSKIGPAVRR